MKKCYKKRISILLILFTILLFNTVNPNTKTAAQENTKASVSKTNEVSTNNYDENGDFFDEIDIGTNSTKKNIIVSSPRPEKFQVWLNYNNSPVIIKPYDSTTSYSKIKDRFEWTTDIKNINDNLIAPKDFKTFSIYVKYKDSTHSFSKTFFCLDDEIRDFNLFTSTDIPSLSSQSILEEDWVHDYLEVQNKYNFTDEILKKSHFPALAKVNEPFYMLVFLNDLEEYSIEIKGDNYSLKLDDLKTNIKGYVQWIPDRTGNFKIVVTKKLKNYSIVLEKKLYVNSSDGKYAQISNIVTDYNDKSITSKLSGVDTFPDDNNNKSVKMKFTVGDPSVWSRTIKNYGTTHGENGSDFIKQKTNYKINDKNSSTSSESTLHLHKGNYKVTSYIKYPNSLEYDDAKAMTVNFQNCDNSNPIYLDLKYNKNNYTFTATAYNDPDHSVEYNPKSNLEYAFILHDCNGYKLVRNYESSNTWTWQLPKPLASGNYTVYAKVRFKEDEYNGNIHDYDPLSLPNSYEAITSIPIKNSSNPNNININYVLLNNELAFYNNNSCNLSIDDHTLYTIDVQPTNEENTNLYKVYSVHEGVMRLLQGYSPNNLIPFYPQSEGDYKLIVLIKDVSSGAYEAKKEITVTTTH